MSSSLHTARSTDNGIARTFVIALLALVLLAGLIPSGALTASHTCKMACCAGKPTHAEGACSAILPSAAKNETPLEADADEHSMQHEGMQASGLTIEAADSSEHCHTAQRASAPAPAPRDATDRQASVAAQAFTAPCSMECAAAVLTPAQVRRPREAAALSIAAHPRPPTFVSSASSLITLLFSSAERRRHSRPRAPPQAFVNLYA